MKTLYIIHCWGGTPDSNWYPWLKEKLEKEHWKVFVLKMPDTHTPTIKNWVAYIQKSIQFLDKDTYFVGHSIGCQAIMRYLETQDKPEIGGIVFVAGWFSLKNLEGIEEEEISRPWLKTPIDFKKTANATSNITAIFSDNDPVVPFKENIKWFKERFNAKILVQNKKGHMTREDGVTKLPPVFEVLT